MQGITSAKRLTAALAVISGSVCAQPAAAADWSDTWAGIRLGSAFREPFNPDDIAKTIYVLQHVSGYKYGTNFFNVDVLKSDDKDPASGGGGGAQEIYVVYKNTVSLSAVSGKPMKFGPTRDLGWEFGLDFNAKDDAFAPRVQKFMTGPTVMFDVPGFLNVGLLYYKEKNHNGIVGASVDFDPTYRIAAAWGIPIKAINSVFKGFFTYTGEKGKDGFGAETAPETLLEASLMFDAGSLAGKKETFYVGVGYQYWKNKFGSDDKLDPTGGSIAKVPQILFEAHF
jgi:nucleoside-specific outer membrane channel protein Tsx